ncbi:hypothetical protein [Allorhizocola rhizosphaerae]|uniref:hypothetical protein n=1 Tax=Allorhizocola rhizosphaerae TaxID=1872709 RepID=UPI0013C2BC5B|nr:hypothetical protein [Allorhizocola rhizosphaerae]
MSGAGSGMEAVASEGLFAKMLDIHDSTRNAVKDSVLQIGALVRNSGQELEKAAKFYDDADEKAKQDIDAKAKRLMHLGGSGTTVRPAGAKTAKNYVDVKDTAKMFTGTPGYTDVAGNDPMKQGFVGTRFEVLELSSIASWIFGTIQGLTGRDLLDELTKQFTGDWEGRAKCRQREAVHRRDGGRRRRIHRQPGQLPGPDAQQGLRPGGGLKWTIG